MHGWPAATIRCSEINPAPRKQPGPHDRPLMGESVQTPPSSLAASSSTIGVSPWFMAMVALLVALYAPTVMWLWGRWTMSVWTNAHGMLIPPVAMYVIWEAVQQEPRRPASPSRWGFLFLIAGLALHVVDGALRTGLLSAASLVIVLPGLVLLLFGTHLTKAIAFPLAFLAFMIPIPLGFVEGLIMALRRVSTVATAYLLPLLGVPVFSEATTLHIARASLEVADACSGFSTLYAALAVGCLTAYTARTPARRLLVLVGAAPIAVIANILRVTALALLVNWQGSDVLATSLHEISGLVTFALVLPIIFWLGADSPTPERRAA